MGSMKSTANETGREAGRIERLFEAEQVAQDVTERQLRRALLEGGVRPESSFYSRRDVRNALWFAEVFGIL